MISIRNLSCASKSKRILDNVSVECPTGTFVALLGPNGAGKSTLIKHLCGILKPLVGSVFIEGKDVRKYSPKELARYVAYVPQAKPTEFPFTVFDMVLMGRYPHLGGPGRPSREDRDAATQALERVGMHDFANQRAATLSGGELQKVFLAAAIAQAGPVLVVDEPTAFLDPKHEGEVWMLLKSLVTDAGRTVLAVTHAVSYMESLSDFVILLKKGRVMAAGETRSVLTEALAQELYDFHCNSYHGNGPGELPYFALRSSTLLT